jgi:hypothetical protein
VVELVVVRDKFTHESKGSAFVWYTNKADADQVRGACSCQLLTLSASRQLLPCRCRLLPGRAHLPLPDGARSLLRMTPPARVQAVLKFNLQRVLADPHGEQDRPLVVRRANMRKPAALMMGQQSGLSSLLQSPVGAGPGMSGSVLSSGSNAVAAAAAAAAAGAGFRSPAVAGYMDFMPHHSDPGTYSMLQPQQQHPQRLQQHAVFGMHNSAQYMQAGAAGMYQQPGMQQQQQQQQLRRQR